MNLEDHSGGENNNDTQSNYKTPKSYHRFNAEQLEQLEAAFEISAQCNGERQKQIARSMEIEPSQTHLRKSDSVLLRGENARLRAENAELRKAPKAKPCQSGAELQQQVDGLILLLQNMGVSHSNIPLAPVDLTTGASSSVTGISIPDQYVSPSRGGQSSWDASNGNPCYYGAGNTFGSLPPSNKGAVNEPSVYTGSYWYPPVSVGIPITASAYERGDNAYMQSPLVNFNVTASYNDTFNASGSVPPAVGTSGYHHIDESLLPPWNYSNGTSSHQGNPGI